MNERKKGKAILRLVIASLVLFALTCALLAGIRGGYSIPFFSFGNSYSNADKYTAGNTTIAASKLEELDINWISGEVYIELWDESEIGIEEEDSRRLPASDQVHSYYEDGTLHIQFAESKGFRFHTFNKNKKLKILLPHSLFTSPEQNPLEELKIDCVSANVIVRDIPINYCSSDTVSGDVDLSGSLKNGEFDAVSGEVHIVSQETPEKLETDTVSGDVSIRVPANSTFTVDFDSTSGDLHNQFPSFYESEPRKWSFESVSGDVTITSLE